MNETCQEPTSAREVLAKLISAPFVLAGRDLLTGERFTRLHAEDLDDFVDAHLLGPGRRDRPARITVNDEAGERRVESFLRPELLPVAGNETCTHIVVIVRTANAAEPDVGLLATAITLREKAAHLFLERSVMTGVWCLWILFDSPLVKADAVAFAEDVRRALQVFATHSLHYEIPLLDGHGAGGTLLPCPFYNADFFGVLFSISHDAYITALPVEPRSDGDVALEALLAAWCGVCPGRYARAEEIISKLSELGLLTGAFSLLAPRSAAILLGRQLTAYAQRTNCRYAVMAKQSGHSKRFLIAPRNRNLS